MAPVFNHNKGDCCLNTNVLYQGTLILSHGSLIKYRMAPNFCNGKFCDFRNYTVNTKILFMKFLSHIFDTMYRHMVSLASNNESAQVF